MFGMSAGDIIRIVLMGIFILVCIALSIVVLMQESKQQVCLVQSVEPLILTGAETKAVQWKENWYYLQRY